MTGPGGPTTAGSRSSPAPTSPRVTRRRSHSSAPNRQAPTPNAPGRDARRSAQRPRGGSPRRLLHPRRRQHPRRAAGCPGPRRRCRADRADGVRASRDRRTRGCGRRRGEAPSDGDTHHAPMAVSGLSADELAASTGGSGPATSADSVARRGAVTSTGARPGHRGRPCAQPAAAGAVLAGGPDAATTGTIRTPSRWRPTSSEPSTSSCCGRAPRRCWCAIPTCAPASSRATCPARSPSSRSTVDLPWRHVTATADEAVALEADERRRPFDLARGPVIRFLLIEKPESAWRFVVVAHHIAIDGWSLPVFVGELIGLYRAGGDVARYRRSASVPRLHRMACGRDPEVSRERWRTTWPASTVRRCCRRR